MNEVILILKELHSPQQAIVNSTARYKVLVCGRRFGKTELAIDTLINHALDTPAPYAYFAPTYKSLRAVYEQFKSVLYPIIAKVNEAEQWIKLINGSQLDFWSLDKPDSGRGRYYKLIVIDEAAIIPKLESAWSENLSQTLIDLQGSALFLSTPKGRNFFHDLYLKGLDPKTPDWQAWVYPSHANPYLPLEELEARQRELPQHAYRQEILAEFLEDAGLVFRGVLDVATAIQGATPEADHEYVFGIDFGRTNDLTAIAVFDRTTNTMVDLDYFTDISWSLQRGHIITKYAQWQPVIIIAEHNSFGSPNIEALQEEGLPVQPFITTQASKAQIVDALALAIERKEVTLLQDDYLINELQAYEVERLPGGAYRYNAPSNLHDDTVIATCLAYHACIYSRVQFFTI